MRILQVTPYHGEAWAYGGIPRVVTALATTLAQRGHEVTVCTTDACAPQARKRRPTPDAAPRAAWPVHFPEPNLELRVFPNLSNRAAYHLQLFTPLGLDKYLRAELPRFDV